MIQLPDDPIIRCIERTGYPPWYFYERGEDDNSDGEPDEDSEGRTDETE